MSNDKLIGTMIPVAQPADSAFCSNCGRQFHTHQLTRIGESWFCPDCKGFSTQRWGDVAALPNTVIYGGFWRRVAAVLIDSFILTVCALGVNQVLGLVVPMHPNFGGPLGPLFWIQASAFGVLAVLANICLGIVYQVYFLTKSGATPGKMALGLKVVTADGGPISTGRAVGRYFAHFLSSLTLLIGYIIVAFDSQKRALHDYICNTRVIRVA